MSIKSILANQDQDVSVKADKTYVDQQLALKANTSDVNSKNSTQDTAISKAQSAADSAQTTATTAQTTASTAQSTATAAQTTANNALPKSGGTMSGEINMGNKKITNLANPTANQDAVNKQYVDTNINDMAAYAEWGDQKEVGDSNWWLALKTWIGTASKKGLESCLGKKKKVSLSSAVQGANKASMICVGYNCDGPGNSLTFQTEGVLPTVEAFGSNTMWSNSTAQSVCNNFGNRCSAYNALKTVTIWYYNGAYEKTRGKAHTTSYSCKCFLPSECQMGGTASDYAMSQDEWTEGSQKIPYQYYTSASTRIKKKMTADGDATESTQYYWERSRAYDGETYVCLVRYTGNFSSDSYSISDGFAPAFVIG